jgi:SAM-dependent methyltransferase
MNSRTALLATGFVLALVIAPAAQQTTGTQKPFEPTVGQPGKDVVWVPTSPALVEKMLDLAKVTSSDFVIDLGSGDGRNIIAAAKRGARGVGVEYNPDMVELSRRLAKEAGVADRATFVQGDMYEADISKATVLALFLLPSNLDKLKDKFLALKPGSRIVLNTFLVTGWQPDVSERLEEGCETWCTAALYIVPAPVAGTWRFDGGEFNLAQEFQVLSGGASNRGGVTAAIAEGRMKGDEITISVGGATYVGKVSGDRITGTVQPRGGGASRPWNATRVK